MNPKLALLLSLLCGAAMPFAFAPYDILPLAVLGLAGWLYITMKHPEHAFKLGWLFGFGWFGFGAWWLADTIHIYGHLPYILGLLSIAVLGSIMALFFALWAWGLSKLNQSKSDVLWLFPILGVFEEWVRCFLFTGLPWTALGNLSLDTPLAAWVSVLGSYGVTFIILLCVNSLVLLFQKTTRKHALVGLAITAGFILFPPHIVTPEQPSRSVVLIQPNIPQDQKWDEEFVQNTMFRLAALSAQNADVDLIVWPEAAVPFYLSRAEGWNAWLNAEFKSLQTPVIFGGIKLNDHLTDLTRKSQNGLFLSHIGTEQRQFVGKHHLVPFGEYVPDWVPWVEKLVPDIGDFEPASDTGILTLNNEKFGSIICYESIFPEEAAARVALGANVLIVVTNDAWYDDSPAAWQHLQASQMRALETGRYVLRATNTGISAIISPDGKIQSTIPWWQEGVVKGHYQPLNHTTPYQQWGDKPVLILMFLGLGLALFRFYRGKQ
ncbi:MAG: apolipoprotein N-acyltransferase [Ghiorsea sp.]